MAAEADEVRTGEVTTDEVRMSFLSLTVAVAPEGVGFTEDEISDDLVTTLSMLLRDLLNMTDLEEVMAKLDSIRDGVHKITHELKKAEAANAGAPETPD